jgi:hypothetical protein
VFCSPPTLTPAEVVCGVISCVTPTATPAPFGNACQPFCGGIPLAVATRRRRRWLARCAA